jgi:hypothetical protein
MRGEYFLPEEELRKVTEEETKPEEPKDSQQTEVKKEDTEAKDKLIELTEELKERRRSLADKLRELNVGLTEKEIEIAVKNPPASFIVFHKLGKLGRYEAIEEVQGLMLEIIKVENELLSEEEKRRKEAGKSLDVLSGREPTFFEKVRNLPRFLRAMVFALLGVVTSAGLVRTTYLISREQPRRVEVAESFSRKEGEATKDVEGEIKEFSWGQVICEKTSCHFIMRDEKPPLEKGRQKLKETLNDILKLETASPSTREIVRDYFPKSYEYLLEAYPELKNDPEAQEMCSQIENKLKEYFGVEIKK